MSNRCSNLYNYKSFSICTPFLTPLKPYTTTRRPFFPFQHNLILIGRRSSSLKVAAQSSSSDVVLIATKEHSDGSLIFRFGDASEVVENDDVVEDIECQTEQESSVVKVLDGDQDRQVIIKKDDSEYDSVEGELIELADGIRNAGIDNDIAESKTNAIRDLSDYDAESSERLLDISKKEVLVSQSDANLNDSIEVVENTLDRDKLSVQLDEEESSDPTVYLLDKSRNIEKSADPEGTLLKDSDDKPVGPSVSVELESMPVSQIEVMDDLDNLEVEDTRKSDTENISVELESTPVSQIEVTDDLDNVEAEDTSKSDAENVSVELESMQVLQIEVKDELDKVGAKDTRKNDAEDTTPYAFPATMLISDIELTDSANEDVEEELKDMIGNEGTLIDELPPSNPLNVRLVDAVNVDAEEELQDMNINEAAIIDKIPSSDQLLGEQPSLDVVSQLQSVHVKDQTMEDELQQVSTKNREENDVAYVMPVLHIEEAGIAVEEEVIQLQSIPFELKPTIQVLDIDLQDTMGQNLDNGILQVDNEIKDSSVSINLEAIQVLDNEVMDATQLYTEDESQMMESKDTENLLPPATMHVSDVDMDERLQDMNISESTFIDEIPASDPSGAVPTLELSTTKGMDGKDVDLNERLQDMNMSEGTFIDGMPTSDPVGTEPTLEVATKVMDVKDVDMDERLQEMNSSESTFIDEMTTSDPIGAEPALEVSTAKDMDLKDVDVDERFQDMNISESTFIDEMPTSNPAGAEPILEVSTTEGHMGVKDLAYEPELQPVSNDNMDENSNADVMHVEPIVEEEVSQPRLAPVELEATMEVSDIKFPDATGQDLADEILQVIGEDAGDSYIKESSRQIDSQPLQDDGVNQNMLEQRVETDALESSILLKEGTHDPILEEERTEGMVGSSELAEASEITALLLAAAAEAEVESREEIYLTDDFLLSGAALLEHPSKALTGTDDAYFVAGSDWLGVANGVSHWSFEGTDPGVYAQELMRTCEEIVLDTSSVPMTNPVELLCRGVKETKMSGSSNVLIANFNGQSLHVANIGDTGFLIIRHGAVYKKSSPLLHEFHFALQVDDSDDPLQLVEEYLIELEVGDIVVSATDGLFDNLYEREITMVVSKSLQAGMKPQEIANVLATRAQEVGKSSLVRSPFSDAAQAAGYTGYTGGKPDNVAVIVSLVEKRSNLLAV